MLLAPASYQMLLVLLATSIVSDAARPKAIILMLGDDYGYNNVGFAHGPANGNPESNTPNMDSLARTGIVLDRLYVYKYCSPTRSSMLTGRLATHVNQNNLNNDIQAKSGPDLRMTLLPAKLKEAGYYTAMVGKSHLCSFTCKFADQSRL
jgi:arylsulfatase A-like enzyme